jgi:2-isopropylmalate synthase
MERAMSEKVVIFDTTLRDGEQSPGISLDPGEKLEIAEQLARLGVDYIEAGFPVASQGDFEAVQAIARSVHGPVIAGLSRTQIADVDRCYEALRDADRNRIHVFISTSPSHMEHMLKMNEAQVLDQVRQGVSRAREHTADVEFSPQDATRTPLDFMLEVLAAAVSSGASTLNIPDTVGYGIPWDYGDLLTHVRQQIAGDYVISTHCHNDLGLATANSLSGVRAGARQVEVCVNGLGERAGNAALEEVVMALKIRPDQFRARDDREHRRAGPHEPHGLASHRLPGAVEQGRRRQERLRARVGHPPARGPNRALHLRDHRCRLGRPGGRADRAR